MTRFFNRVYLTGNRFRYDGMTDMKSTQLPIDLANSLLSGQTRILTVNSIVNQHMQSMFIAYFALVQALSSLSWPRVSRQYTVTDRTIMTHDRIDVYLKKKRTEILGYNAF